LAARTHEPIPEGRDFHLSLAARTLQAMSQGPRELPVPAGLPDGWKSLEMTYKSGKSMGQTYVRFKGPHPGMSNVCTIKQAIRLQAEHDGKDPEKTVQDFERWKKEREEQEKQTREAENKKMGLMKVQERDAAIAAFRERFGPLDGTTVTNWPGWKKEEIWLPACQQVRREWYDPRGNKWLLMKDLEANYGQMILNGDRIEDLVEIQDLMETDATARLQRQSESRASRREGDEPRRKRRRLAGPGDYLESRARVLRVLGRTAQGLRAAGCPGPEELERTQARVAELLRGRGFASAALDLVAVVGQGQGRAPERLGGVYYRLAEDFNERPCYQRVLVPAVQPPRLACRPEYIFWSSISRWKIGTLDDSKAGFAFCCEDVAHPVDTAKPWMILNL